MKKLVVFSFCVLSFNITISAQSSQIKLYIQQIAANKVLIEYIQKGYKIARTSLTTIGDIRNGEFNLHKDFFGALKNVNPAVKKSAMVLDIMTLEYNTLTVCKNQLAHISKSGQFTETEMEYIQSVLRKLMNSTVENLNELVLILTTANYKMSDDERIKRIEILHSNMQREYRFALHFGNSAKILAAQRMQGNNDVETSRMLQGLENN